MSPPAQVDEHGREAARSQPPPLSLRLRSLAAPVGSAVCSRPH